MKYKGYIKLPCEVEANDELEAKEKIADKLSDDCFCTFIREDVELETDNIGEWITYGKGFCRKYICNKCGAYMYVKFNFCPNCGNPKVRGESK